ncbi:MAG: hypothetical protein WA989_07115 [Henriciella sp.]|uniref:hypothetical protein n=1 Tax=Henriciella sp. TaxID=1968823 RepID=UPI003C73BEEF
MSVARQLFIEEPVEIEVGLGAEAPIERLFDLLDFGSPGNALRERGFLFLDEPMGSIGRFRATDPVRPDVIYSFEVDVCEWPSRIRYETQFETDDQDGSIERSISDYNLTSTGSDTARLHLVETCWMKAGYSRKRQRMEQAMLNLAVREHVTRLCVHASLGIEEAQRRF